MMMDEAKITFDWQDLTPGQGWENWRATKIREFEYVATLPPIEMDSLAIPGTDALREIKNRCATANWAAYQCPASDASVVEDAEALAALARALGLARSEDHRSAEDFGVVALRTSDAPSKAGYIPYTKRPLNWHTDGYYNPSGRPILSFALHCHHQAASGGENQLIDPEMAYLAMRDENPAFVAAMMAGDAMTIPENREPDGTLRPASTGPVFFADPASGRLQMRYTARTRSIAWADDPATRDAAHWLREWLTSDNAPTINIRMKAGQGIVSNNALHNRTGFEDGATTDDARVMLRVRFHERLGE